MISERVPLTMSARIVIYTTGPGVPEFNDTGTSATEDCVTLIPGVLFRNTDSPFFQEDNYFLQAGYQNFRERNHRLPIPGIRRINI
jgi:hypothetical protein